MTTNTPKKPRAKLEAVKPAELPAECCKKCKFFMADGDAQGMCRRYPATPIFMGQGVIAFFPSMLNAGWCGEFAPIPALS